MTIEALLAWIEPLVVPGFDPPPYDPQQARATLAAAGRSAADHERFLTRWNGCYALGGALHVLGAREAPPNQSLDAWNRADGWRQSFGALVEGVTFFAESAFGDQFGYRDGKVVRLRVFDGRIERLAADFAEWLGLRLTSSLARFLATDLFEQCVRRPRPAARPAVTSRRPRPGHPALPAARRRDHRAARARQHGAPRPWRRSSASARRTRAGATRRVADSARRGRVLSPRLPAMNWFQRGRPGVEPSEERRSIGKGVSSPLCDACGATELHRVLGPRRTTSARAAATTAA
jgi:hypothetical protein